MTVILGGGELCNALKNELPIGTFKIIEHTDSVYMLSQLKELVDRYKYIEDVIITSGYLNKHFIGEYTVQDIEQIIDANMIFPIKAINLLSAISNKTRVTVISSSVTFDSKRHLYSVYAASKLGLERFIQSSLRGDGPLRIRIIRLARMDSKLRWNNYEKNDENIKNLLNPKEVAQNILNFLDKNDIVLEIFKTEGKVVCNPRPLIIKSM